MEKRRHVETAMSMFKLTIRDALCLPETVQTGVTMLYDRKANQREFSVLDHSLSSDLKDRIVSWLEHNTDSDDILWGLKSNAMDADHFRSCLPDA
ncbi:MAG: hypothetical protein AB1512_06755 [Thermodesulfobacteriota bacterium]